MSRTSAPVLASMLIMLLLLLPRDTAVAIKTQFEVKNCKTLDEVLLEKYVTGQKRFSNDNVKENATPLPFGSTDSNWLGLYLLLRDGAEQLCNKTLYTFLNERYSIEVEDELVTRTRQNTVRTTAVSETGYEDQQANNVTLLSSTTQKESTWINASTTITYNNDESSRKFFRMSEVEESTTSYYESLSTLPGNFNQTFTIADNEASGNNSKETLASDNEDELDRNEVIHAPSNEAFFVFRSEQSFGQNAEIVQKLLESQHETDDGDETWRVRSANKSEEIGNVSDDNSIIDEQNQLANDFSANENTYLSSGNFNGHHAVNSETTEMLYDNSDDNETVSERDRFVDNFFTNEYENLPDSEFKNDFFNGNTTEVLSRENNVESLTDDDDEFVYNFFKNKNCSENEIRRDLHPYHPFTPSLSDVVNVTSSELAETTELFKNNSNENVVSNLENSTEILDSSDLISSQEFLEVAISDEKNTIAAATLMQTYSNETVTLVNGTEDRSMKYLDTGDRNKAGYTSSTGDDLFKEMTTTTSNLDDWSTTIESIESYANEVLNPAVRRRKRDILMTLRNEARAVVSAGKLRKPDAASSRLVIEEDDSSDAWESSNSLNTGASSRNRPHRIITAEMNKDSAELQKQYRTFLLGLQSRQTQFAEKSDSRSQASAEVEQ